ncbi:Gamma-glutamyltranspeptidase precursor [Planctomycetes bacterium Pla163]|uniref:Glutathione hydrolase proenzyme n=1 Tax=Rohdeia mirabilis TaxID=2528008 RepID=A0A518D120_9BACT|nr:Gamma-glutamyltranspeptidase precursor [Planctomycetes bacterium Pla163]
MDVERRTASGDRCGWRQFGVVALLLATVHLAACAGPTVVGEPRGDGPAAVVSAHPLATLAGTRVLEEGGNAADAAVATALALAVVYPQAGNLGGGGFAVWVPSMAPADALALDFRETAPRELDAADFDRADAAGQVDRSKAIGSVLAAGVPGSPRGLIALQSRLGRLSFAEVAAPAIELARDGFEVDPHLASDLASPSLRARLEASPGARALFYPDGEPLLEGDLLVQPDLARTLEHLVAHGPAGFYDGPVADAIVATMRSDGGEMDAVDLAAYQHVWRTPVVSSFGRRTLVTMPPPSSGGILILQVFEILEGEGFDYADAEPDARELHWWIEALRAGFADRAEHLGDPDYYDVPVAQLLDRAWIAQRRHAIGEFAQPDILPWVPPVPEGGGETTHLSVLDADGNAVSLTTTLNTTFGSGIMVEGAGFLLNNEMDDFAIRPGVPNAYGLVGNAANAIEPGKRPLSSMTPTVVCAPDGSVELVIGSPGGPRIITSVFQVLARVLVHGQRLEDAIRAPRLHQQWKPLRTFVEVDFPEELVEDLVRRGHAIERESGRWSSVQGILIGPDGELQAFSDARRGGAAGAPGEGLLHRPARP